MQVIAWLLTAVLMALWSVLFSFVHGAVLMIADQTMSWSAILGQLAVRPIRPAFLTQWQPTLLSWMRPTVERLVDWFGWMGVSFPSLVVLGWLIGLAILLLLGFSLNGAIVNYRRNHSGEHHRW